MDYDNLTKENFIEHISALQAHIWFVEKIKRELKGEKTQFRDFLNEDNTDFFSEGTKNLIDIDLFNLFISNERLDNDKSKQNDLCLIYNKVNERLYKLISFSEANDIYFRLCTLKTYIITFEKRLEKYLKKNIVLDKKDFLLKEIDSVLNPYFGEKRDHFNEISKRILINSREKKVEFLKNKLLDLNIVVKIFEIDYKKPKPKHIQSFDINETPQLTKPTKTNKSLMFNGNNLNIQDRYRILNKVLNFDKIVHPLNIGELEKYQLLAYILGCDKDNARKLMNGSHDAKDNDLTLYFDSLGLNKYKKG